MHLKIYPITVGVQESANRLQYIKHLGVRWGRRQSAATLNVSAKM